VIQALKRGKFVAGALTLDMVLPLLCATFNACVRLGTLPREWSFCAITPILKPGGNGADCCDDRLMGSLAAKVFVNCPDSTRGWSATT
jgi:hypothetical protein